MILGELLYSAQDNREFMKVLHILQNDGELRPLIFEHEALLRTLKDMKELKAEQMLSILTAAETEMYESSKKNEELIQQQKLMNSGNKGADVPKQSVGVAADLLSVAVQDKLEREAQTLREELKVLEQDKERYQK